MEGLSSYGTQKKLSKMFDSTPSWTTRVCRAIDANEDRYSDYGKIGGKYSAVAFADAYTNLSRKDKWQPPLKFKPEIIKKFIVEQNEEDKQDYYEFGFNEAWHSIYDDVKEYFDTTQVPVESEEVVRAIRNGVLSAIVNVTEG